MAIYDASRGPKYDIIVRWVGEGRRVLDVGCGSGAFSARLAERNDVTGVELSEENLRVARSRVPVLVGDFLDLEFRDRYDIVLFGDVLEHMQSPEEALAKARRLADEVIICVPNGGGLVVPVLKWLGVRTNTGPLDRTHIVFFAKAEIESALLDCGWTRVEYAAPRPRRAPDAYQRLIDWWPELFAIQFMYRCRAR